MSQAGVAALAHYSNGSVGPSVQFVVAEQQLGGMADVRFGNGSTSFAAAIRFYPSGVAVPRPYFAAGLGVRWRDEQAGTFGLAEVGGETPLFGNVALLVSGRLEYHRMSGTGQVAGSAAAGLMLWL